MVVYTFTSLHFRENYCTFLLYYSSFTYASYNMKILLMSNASVMHFQKHYWFSFTASRLDFQSFM